MKSYIYIFSLSAILLLPAHLKAETALYRGTMDVVSGSGKLCRDSLGKHAVSLVLVTDGSGKELKGYFEGENLTIGTFSGSDQARLKVSYPFHDADRASGHLISLFRSTNQLTGELHDKHVDDSSEECSFDQALLNLQLAAEGDSAEKRLLHMARLFDAQLANSQALDLAGKGSFEAAVPLFEKVLDLSDADSERAQFPVDSAIAGLSSSYFRLGRFKEFSSLYDRRIESVSAVWARALLNSQQETVQLHLARAAAGRGEYDAALNRLLPAYNLNKQNLELIGAIVTTYVRSDRLDDAARFLEKAESVMARDSDRKEIAGAFAMVSFLKARKAEKDGRISEAEDNLRDSVSRNPEFAAPWVALARQRHKAGNFEEARKLLLDGLKSIKDEQARNEITAALEKMQQIETIMKAVR